MVISVDSYASFPRFWLIICDPDPGGQNDADHVSNKNDLIQVQEHSTATQECRLPSFNADIIKFIVIKEYNFCENFAKFQVSSRNFKKTNKQKTSGFPNFNRSILAKPPILNEEIKTNSDDIKCGKDLTDILSILLSQKLHYPLSTNTSA